MFLVFCITLMGIQYGIAQNLLQDRFGEDSEGRERRSADNIVFEDDPDDVRKWYLRPPNDNAKPSDPSIPDPTVGQSCAMFYTNISGVCTLASKCPSARKEYQMNGIPPTICKHSGKKLLVCCIDGSSSLETSTAAVLRKPVNSKRVSERKCEEYSQIVYRNGGDKCQNTDVDLLVGSESANQGEFAHMAAIGGIGPNYTYQFSCGGSLISSRFVLTAGQCMRNAFTKDVPSIVRLGYQILEPKIRNDANPIDIPIKTFLKYPQYMPPKRYNDIGLIELNIDVNFNADIRPACLWNKPDFPGYSKAIAVVWGGNDTAEHEHYKVLLSLLENDYCDALLESKHNRFWNGLTESQLCAGELRGGKHRCKGTSGTPLQVTSKDNKCVYHIIAFISFGPRCAYPDFPVVYTRVSSYLDWIESVVWPGEK